MYEEGALIGARDSWTPCAAAACPISAFPRGRLEIPLVPDDRECRPAGDPVRERRSGCIDSENVVREAGHDQAVRSPPVGVFPGKRGCAKARFRGTPAAHRDGRRRSQGGVVATAATPGGSGPGTPHTDAMGNAGDADPTPCWSSAG